MGHFRLDFKPSLRSLYSSCNLIFELKRDNDSFERSFRRATTARAPDNFERKITWNRSKLPGKGSNLSGNVWNSSISTKSEVGIFSYLNEVGIFSNLNEVGIFSDLNEVGIFSDLNEVGIFSDLN